MTQFVLLALLMSGSVAGAALAKKRFEELLPITCAGIVAIMFLFGCFGALKTGIYCVIAICVSLWIVSVYKLLKEKRWGEFFKNSITPGFVIFIGLYFVFGFLSRDMVAKEWDEFSHWADIVKAMVQIDDFGTNPRAYAIFPSYPPGMALFQYFVQKIYLMIKPDQSFSEWRLFFSYQVFFLTFFMPFFKGLSFKSPIRIVILGITVWLAPMLIFTNIYDCIYIDPILGFIAGTAFAMVFVKKERDWVYDIFIYASISMLILMKDAGMLFAAFLFIAYIADILCDYNIKNIKSSINQRNMRKVLLSIGSLAIPKFLWARELKISQTIIAFGGKVHIDEVIRIISGKEPNNYRTEVLNSYILAMKEKTIEIGDTSVELSYVLWILLLLGIVWFLYLGWGKKDTDHSKSRSVIGLLLTIVTVVFVIGMCTSYMYKFSQEEALRLAAFSRYLRIILHCLWVFVLSVLFYLCANNQKVISKMDVLIMLVCILVTPWSRVGDHVTRETIAHAYHIRAPYQQIADQIEKLQGDNSEGLILHVICSEVNWCEHLVLGYSLRPHRFEWNYSSELTTEEWLAEVTEYIDYVVLFRINDEFLQRFSDAFENPEDIQELSVYKINEVSGTLERVSQ